MDSLIKKIQQSQEGSLAIMLVMVILSVVLVASLTIATTRITRIQFVQDTRQVITARAAAASQRDFILRKLTERATEMYINEYYAVIPSTVDQTNCDTDTWVLTDEGTHEYCMKRIGYVDNPAASIPKQLEEYELLARSVFPTGDVVGKVKLFIEAPYSSYTVLRPTELGADEGFGSDVAIYKDTIVVGAACDSSTCTGRAFVFEWSTTTLNWDYQILNPSEPETFQRFGADVAIDGDWIVIGARFNDDFDDNDDLSSNGDGDCDGDNDDLSRSDDHKVVYKVKEFFRSLFVKDVSANGDGGCDKGAAYLFKRIEDGSWEEKVMLQPGTGFGALNNGDEYGAAVAIDGNQLVIGAPRRNQNAGTVYVYERQSDDSWQFEKEITGPTVNGIQGGSHFGSEVAVYNSEIAIAAARRDVCCSHNRHGEVYMFEKQGGSWTEIQTLTSLHPKPEGEFGWDLSFREQTLVIGEHWNNNPDEPPGGSPSPPLPGIIKEGNTNKAGAAYIYDKKTGVWLLKRKIYSLHENPDNEEFGSHVASYGNVVAVGARGITGDGFVVVHEKDTAYKEFLWVQRLELTSPSALPDNFGSVALSDKRLVVGAPWDNVKGSNAGAIYIYDR